MVLAQLEQKFQPCWRVLISLGSLDRSERRAPALLVIFPGVLNLGDADAGGTLAGEPQQFIAGDFITQFLGNQGRSIGAHGLQHLLPERRISGDVSKKLPELVRAHAVGNVVPILPGLVFPPAC